jgi:hypothetical protein
MINDIEQKMINNNIEKKLIHNNNNLNMNNSSF